jgi:hypothetical protein
MRKRILFLSLLLAAAGAACNGDSGTDSEAASGASGSSGDTEAINPADFSPAITHPLLPLSAARTTEFAGRQKKDDGGTTEIRVVSKLLDKTDTIAGVTVAVVEVTEHKDGQLHELTEDYYAQHRDGTVWYFGERVTNYKDGKSTDNEGTWLAGENGHRPGVFMPAIPTIGQEFAPEQIPGVADERAKVLELGLEVTVPAGKFTDCMKTEDRDLLDNQKEFKFYCPRAGLVREEGPKGSSELVRLA